MSNDTFIVYVEYKSPVSAVKKVFPPTKQCYVDNEASVSLSIRSVTQQKNRRSVFRYVVKYFVY